MEDAEDRIPRYREIYLELRHAIADGDYKEADRLPSESVLAKRYSTSRLTVARAVKELQNEGLVRRRPGSGTYVCGTETQNEFSFGLLIPNLGETEIFEPICQGMARAARLHGHSLLWSAPSHGAGTKEQQIWELCEHYIAKKISGVFFAPVELTPSMDEVNAAMVKALDGAGIAVVLLDRDLSHYPRRSRYDLVGIDNYRAGYLVTEHLARLGSKRIVFFSRPHSATTVDVRIRGYRQAMDDFGLTFDPGFVRCGDPNDRDLIRTVLKESKPEAFVCANDYTAGALMLSLNALGIRIPNDIRIVGIDGVKYASLLHVPLTTLRQPCADIGAAAVSAMLERIAQPEIPARDILLDCQIVVRESCGSTLER